jgi:hypothetical protein
LDPFFSFESSFQNFFWSHFITSGLSQICKIRNAWKLSSPFSRITLIPCSEKTSWVQQNYEVQRFGGKPYVTEIFKLQQVISQLMIRVIFEIFFGRFSYFTDLKQTRSAKNISKTVLKIKLKTKKITYTLVFGKYFVVPYLAIRKLIIYILIFCKKQLSFFSKQIIFISSHI